MLPLNFDLILLHLNFSILFYKARLLFNEMGVIDIYLALS